MICEVQRLLVERRKSSEWMETCVVHAVDLNMSCAATTAVTIVGALNALVAVSNGFATITASGEYG